eukprot:gene11302-13148_t
MDQANLYIDGYTILSKVGGGGFGEVFLGKDNVTGQEVAIKVEQVGYREPQLRHEYKVYRELERRSVTLPTGFCRAVKFHGTEQHNYMVMDLLGSSLSDLFRNTCSKKFSLKTVLQIADQVLERIEVFHSVNLIHRDISSGNFMIGRHDPDTIYFIDFGMSTRYRDPHTLEHNVERSAASRRGTTRYASINNLLGKQQSRRDDLESIAYILIRFLRRELPWEHVSSTHFDKPHRVVRDMKINMPISTLCEGLPNVFADFLRYARDLQFAEEPDLRMWRARFRALYEQQGYHKQPFTWDWTNMPARPKRGASVLTEPAPSLLPDAQAHLVEREVGNLPPNLPSPPPTVPVLVHASGPFLPPDSDHNENNEFIERQMPSEEATPRVFHPTPVHPTQVHWMEAQMQPVSASTSVLNHGEDTSHFLEAGKTRSYSPSLAGTHTFSRSRDTLDTMYTLAAASMESLGTVPEGENAPFYATLMLPSPLASPLRGVTKTGESRMAISGSLKSLNASFYRSGSTETDAAVITPLDPNASTKTLPL